MAIQITAVSRGPWAWGSTNFPQETTRVLAAVFENRLHPSDGGRKGRRRLESPGAAVIDNCKRNLDLLESRHDHLQRAPWETHQPFREELQKSPPGGEPPGGLFF